MNSIYLSIGLLILIGVLIYIFKPKTFYTRYGTRIDLENFKANSNITNQSPMNFSYLNNKNYANNILATYYLNDDTKISGNRVINHPLMYSYNHSYGLLWWEPNRSNSTYNITRVRL